MEERIQLNTQIQQENPPGDQNREPVTGLWRQQGRLSGYQGRKDFGFCHAQFSWADPICCHWESGRFVARLWRARR